MECELTDRQGPIGYGKATAKVDGKVAVVAELTFAIGQEIIWFYARQLITTAFFCFFRIFCTIRCMKFVNY